MAKEPVKANLFRFVTLRNPQLIDEKEKDPGFVFHPDESKNAFYNAVKNLPGDQKPAALRLVSDGFTAFNTRAEIRETNKKLYAFSTWLMRNKNALSFSSIKENIDGVDELSATSEDNVWDNLIYQTINKESVYVREACIQLLIANKFLTAFLDFAKNVEVDHEFTEDEIKAFTRRAYASVVISKILFTTPSSSNSANQNKVSLAHVENLLNDGEIQIAKQDIQALKVFKAELKPIEIVYNKTTQKAYQSALDDYNELVENLIDDAKPVIVETEDPETGKIISTETYPNLKLPKFEFTKEEAITSKYLDTKLTEESKALFNGLNLDIYDTFNELNSAINKELKGNYKTIYSKAPKKSRNVSVNGNPITLNNSKSIPVNIGIHCFNAGIKYRSSTFNTPNSLPTYATMELNAGYINASATLTYTFENLTTNETITQSTPVSNYGGLNTYIRFLMNPDALLRAGNYTFTATINLDNGTQLEYVVNNINLIKDRTTFFSGCEEVDVSNPNEDPIPTKPLGQLYGVTNLGIADFRRVEQEVCCYVPGEVSHIENIMASEYKERSTRNLLSSETTIEKTDEVEHESLTDTTTTERNEMQTEVASVLNEDESQAYGASASVQGEYGKIKFGADAYFDAASSSSSSNSNSQALTYAQEVTERAMERIVQKTQTKRTSRILKEFEENNKHGFDNTKGSEHVTGVYRWVDKVYKNTLLNYGKRLMYEFAIPEPSRFFKEAIWKQIEDGTIESGIILPEPPQHPETIVGNIESINNINYLLLAKEYGIELPTYPEDETYIGKAFGFQATEVKTDNHERYGEGAELEIPEGYYTVEASATWTNSEDSIVARPVKPVAGDKRLLTNGAYVDIDPFTGNIPLSYSAYTVLSGSINFSIKLLRLDEYLQGWKSEVFSLAMEAYEQKLREYNDAQRENEIQPFDSEEKLRFNPLFNRSIEKKEIKRIAIQLLTETRNILTAKNNYNGTSTTSVKKNDAFQTHASTVKFFEQAFDWDIMAYIFYPYFYASENEWEALFQEQDGADPLFQAFLQSGMSRAVIPVRPGFEDAVNWYMETGEIWNGQGLVIDQDDDLYVSVAEEMQTVEGTVEGTWETKLPTALTILQAESAALDEKGLPCFCEDHAKESTIISSVATLQGATSTEDPN